MAWIELTVHWIVSDCDVGEVSVYTPSKGCVGLRVYGLHTGVRGHVANMCPGLIALSGIRLRQQLSGKCTNGTI